MAKAALWGNVLALGKEVLIYRKVAGERNGRKTFQQVNILPSEEFCKICRIIAYIETQATSFALIDEQYSPYSFVTRAGDHDKMTLQQAM